MVSFLRGRKSFHTQFGHHNLVKAELNVLVWKSLDFMHTFVFVLYFNLTLLYFRNDIARNAEKIPKGIGINA